MEKETPPQRSNRVYCYGSGNCFANFFTSAASFFSIVLSVYASSANSIIVAILVISFSPIPLDVSAGVPSLIPLGSSGDLWSNGSIFLLTVIPMLSSTSCALFPVSHVFSVHRNACVTSSKTIWLSVHSVITCHPRSLNSSARCFALSMICFAYFLNAGCIAS